MFVRLSPRKLFLFVSCVAQDLMSQEWLISTIVPLVFATIWIVICLFANEISQWLQQVPMDTSLVASRSSKLPQVNSQPQTLPPLVKCKTNPWCTTCADTNTHTFSLKPKETSWNINSRQWLAKPCSAKAIKFQKRIPHRTRNIASKAVSSEMVRFCGIKTIHKCMAVDRPEIIRNCEESIKAHQQMQTKLKCVHLCQA